jgi:hypothetical protein
MTFLGNNIPWKKFPWKKNSLEKKFLGKNFLAKKFLGKRIPWKKIPWKNISLLGRIAKNFNMAEQQKVEKPLTAHKKVYFQFEF